MLFAFCSTNRVRQCKTDQAQLPEKSPFALLQISVCLSSIEKPSYCSRKKAADSQIVRPFEIPAIITTQGVSKHGPCVPSIKQRLADNTPEFEKLKFSMLTNEVVDFLKLEKRDHVVVVGVEAHICVAQTAFGK